MMRLSSFHIDGFGTLADIGLEEMAPGLVVILGPNEAGKSTLFDFLAGVLFGFPNRKDNSRYHAPARGGRHGGRVGFVDEAGGTWVVERHAGPQRGLEVRLPDGSEGDEASLTRALAGASSSLFRAVFAVDLEDLGQMDNLESDEVRELLFAASIFGQRRSATKAMQHLADVRDELARPRRDGAAGNRLALDLETVRGELAAARQETATYESLQREAAAAEEQMRATRSQLKTTRDRERELELLEACWRHYCAARRARSTLALTPEVGAAAALLEHGAELRRLTTELSGHVERATKLEDLIRNRTSLDASIERRLSGLGPLWTRERAMDAPDPELLAASVRATRDRLSAWRTDAVSAAAVLAQAQALRADCDDRPGAGDPPMVSSPERAELELRTEALAELRERLSEAERVELEMLADERGQVSPLPAHGASGRSARLPVLVGCAFAVAVFALIVVLSARDQTTLAMLALVLGPILGVAAVLVATGERRVVGAPVEQAGAPREEISASGELASDRARLMARSRTRIAELAEALGLEVPPSRVDLERCAAALQQAGDARRRLDDLSAARDEAEARVARAVEADRAAQQAVSLEQRVFEAWCNFRGFVATGPEATLEAIAALADLREQLVALGRVDKAIDALEGSVTGFVHRCSKLLEVIDPGAVEAMAGRDGTAELEAMLGRLVLLLDDATDVDGRRSQLEHELSNAETTLEHTLGGGAAAERLRAELARSDVLEWAAERADLEPSIEALRKAEEDAVRRHQSVAEAIERLATSDRIADLELRHHALEVDLDRVLRRYLVLGTARALLQRTLTRHERDRQPAVVASAAAHFERVTSGRYTALLADAGTDGKQTIRVLSSTGEAIDAAKLSRGTIEQLYLCLRLGLADSFAERSVSLPIVLDDVLVNFDPDRATAVATELAATARSHQMVFLTCHPHLAEMMLRAAADSATESQLIELGRIEPDSRQVSLPLLTALPPLSA
jgi:uncharacterized protein YhaN